MSASTSISIYLYICLAYSICMSVGWGVVCFFCCWRRNCIALGPSLAASDGATSTGGPRGTRRPPLCAQAARPTSKPGAETPKQGWQIREAISDRRRRRRRRRRQQQRCYSSNNYCLVLHTFTVVGSPILRAPRDKPQQRRSQPISNPPPKN